MKAPALETSPVPGAERKTALAVHQAIPPGGLFAGHQWRISPAPFALPKALVQELETLGRVLLQFYRAADLLYRKSLEGKQPEWVARWLDQGKPGELLALARSPALKSEVPRVIRPDLLITGHDRDRDGPLGSQATELRLTELDSVPGGIGLTAWLGQTYSHLGHPVIGGADGMARGFESIFGDAASVHIVVSEEAATYRPEMVWLAEQLNASTNLGFHGPAAKEGPLTPALSPYEGERENRRQPEGEAGPGCNPSEGRGESGKLQRLVAGVDADVAANNQRFRVQDTSFTGFADGDAVYRFFELFDLANVPNSARIFELAAAKHIRLTPPAKPCLEEKMLLALLWNRNLREFWRQELGDGFFQRLLRLAPYSWVVDPAPLPPHAAIPELNLTDWRQLQALSQRERDLILKVSGFSPHAWGARGVYLGSDLAHADWAAAVEKAIAGFGNSPFVLQRYHKPALVPAQWYDFEHDQVVPMNGRVRLCPYYFVSGEAERARAHLGGVLATICPADKKIIHGMSEAILAPCGLEVK